MNSTKKMHTLCEHQICFAQDGFQCIFPFIYKNVEYNNCSTADVYQPWCPTGNMRRNVCSLDLETFNLSEMLGAV